MSLQRSIFSTRLLFCRMTTIYNRPQRNKSLRHKNKNIQFTMSGCKKTIHFGRFYDKNVVENTQIRKLQITSLKKKYLFLRKTGKLKLIKFKSRNENKTRQGKIDFYQFFAPYTTEDTGKCNTGTVWKKNRAQAPKFNFPSFSLSPYLSFRF